MFSVTFRELLMQTPGAFEEADAFYKRLNAFLRQAHNDDGTLIAPAPAQVSELGLAVGTIVPYAGSTTPTGWLLCDGTAYSRAMYRTLFTAIGTTFGTGDGATTFNVPNLSGKFPLGKATAGTGSTLGSTGGSLDHTHTGPSHTHVVTSTTTAVQAGAGTTVVDAVTSPTGASGAGNTGSANPAFLALNYLILYA